MLSTARTRLTATATALSTLKPRYVPRANYYSPTLPRLSSSENPNPANADPEQPRPNVSASNAAPMENPSSSEGPLQESPEAGERSRQLQAPNRASTWAGSQQPREYGMTGPRFEQTIMEFQPQPYAAIELIHKQPVRWTKNKVVSCDGGGGPLGHPKIYINTDKPEIATCGYCGLPFAQETHRKYLESLPATSYPLKPTGDPAEINENQRVTEGGWEQR